MDMLNEKIIDMNDLENVTGGKKIASQKEQLMRMECPYCHDVFQADVSKKSVKCPACEKIIEIKG